MPAEGYRGKRKKSRKWFNWGGSKKTQAEVKVAAAAKKPKKSGKTLPPVTKPIRKNPIGTLEKITHETLASYEGSARSQMLVSMAENIDDMAKRFATLNQMISDVYSRMVKESDEFEELKFSEYMKFQDTPEEDSYELESMDTNPELVHKRSVLGKTVLLLSNLETNRSVLKSQLIGGLLEMNKELQRKSFNITPILKELERLQLESEAVVNHATSDGEATPEDDTYSL